jgi:hypothetical protein
MADVPSPPQAMLACKQRLKGRKSLEYKPDFMQYAYPAPLYQYGFFPLEATHSPCSISLLG